MIIGKIFEENSLREENEVKECFCIGLSRNDSFGYFGRLIGKICRPFLDL